LRELEAPTLEPTPDKNNSQDKNLRSVIYPFHILFVISFSA